ncbi:MAG: Inositol-1-phosphate synthase [Candidatus Bipolaricaulis sibiricus]|uniref:Inositol-1-phosphate synthase n=1 Tax=Bipolaricaulis sibiricus TaxID=2501609 RepID=A0A410FSJ2_BIPS1|nr:MAG: Inositol-1-phosphate synthase [Candidatus Bipolaricaulis sibiricus]
MERCAKEIRVALIGVGNCASALVQGCAFYSGMGIGKPGLQTVCLVGYRPEDIVFAAAYDIDARKVGLDLSEAIFASPNCTTRFVESMPLSSCVVRPGFEIDGVGPVPVRTPEHRRFLPIENVYSSLEDARRAIVAELVDARVQVVANFLPVGSNRSARFYAECALEAGCAFVNAMPSLMAHEMGERFRQTGLPYLGDDVKSQVGATILHRALASLFCDRGIPIKRTYQLNVGGNTDFLNMLDEDRLEDKRRSKTEAVLSQLDASYLDPDGVYIGPSDYVSWLNDRKVCFLRIEAEQFGGVPMEIEIRLSVEDSPNSAGVMMDAVRAARVALDRGLAGPISDACAYLFKSPPVQFDEQTARQLFRQFVAEVNPSGGG